MVKDIKYLYLLIVIAFLATTAIFGFIYIGPVIVAIIGGAGVGGHVDSSASFNTCVCWYV